MKRKLEYIEERVCPTTRTQAYVVIFGQGDSNKNKKRKTKTFSFKKHGGKRKALREAKRFRSLVLSCGGYDGFEKARKKFIPS